MTFLEIRNKMMTELAWNRRVATLATRLLLGVDTVKSITSTPSFHGTPLLSQSEYYMIEEGVGKLTWEASE